MSFSGNVSGHDNLLHWYYIAFLNINFSTQKDLFSYSFSVFCSFNLFSSSTSFPFCACMLSLTAGWFLAGILWIDWWGHLITVSAPERGAFSYLHILGTDTLSLFSRHQFFFSTAPELLILFVIFSFPPFSVAQLYKAVLCSAGLSQFLDLWRTIALATLLFFSTHV